MNISCKSVTKVFSHSVQALREFSLEIKSGEFIVVMGESGCGKSTLLRLLSGVLSPTSGELYLNGVPSGSIPPQQRDCAMIFQNYSLYPSYTVYDNVAFYLKDASVPPKEIEKRVMPVLRFFGLEDYKNVKPKYLSGGQQQKVCLAKALVRKPKLLLFDEPLSNIDEQSREDYLALIKATKRLMKDTTFVYVTHNSHEARFLADRIVVMIDGKAEAVGTVEELLLSPQTIDTLYMVCGSELTVEKGFVENGVFYGEEKHELNRLYKKAYTNRYENVTRVKSLLQGDNDYYFDENGKVLFGVKDKVLLPVYKSGNRLIYNDQSILLTDEQTKRIILSDGDALMGLTPEKLHSKKCFDDILLEFQLIDEDSGKYLYFDGKNYFFLPYKIEGKLYYGVDDISLFDKNGSKVLVKYPLKSNTTDGRVRGGTAYIGKNKFDTDLRSGFYDFKFDLDAFIKTSKRAERNTLTVSECIAEDDLGDKKLAYFISPYFSDYCAFFVPKDVNLLTRKKFNLLLDTKKIKRTEE